MAETGGILTGEIPVATGLLGNEGGAGFGGGPLVAGEKFAPGKVIGETGLIECPGNGPFTGGGPISGRGTDPVIGIPLIKGCTGTCGGADKFTNEATLFCGRILAAPFVRFVTLLSLAESDFKLCIKAEGKALGISKPRNFKLINLHAILNSFMSIFPSASVSDKAHICPRMTGGSCDLSKNSFACSPVTTPLIGFKESNCSLYLARSLGWITQGSIPGV